MRSSSGALIDWPKAWAEALAVGEAVTLGCVGIPALEAAGLRDFGYRTRPDGVEVSPAGGWDSDLAAFAAMMSWETQLIGAGAVRSVKRELEGGDPRAMAAPDSESQDIALDCLPGPDGPAALLRLDRGRQSELILAGADALIGTLLANLAADLDAQADESERPEIGAVLHMTYAWDFRRRRHRFTRRRVAEATVWRVKDKADLLVSLSRPDGTDSQSFVPHPPSEANRLLGEHFSATWALANA